jgi:hypothetical protein
MYCALLIIGLVGDFAIIGDKLPDPASNVTSIGVDVSNLWCIDSTMHSVEIRSGKRSVFIFAGEFASR